MSSQPVRFTIKKLVDIRGPEYKKFQEAGQHRPFGHTEASDDHLVDTAFLSYADQDAV
jgi:hypothetical protein